jgi:hypothetical protein
MSLWKVILILAFLTMLSLLGFKFLVNLEQTPQRSTLGIHKPFLKYKIPICKDECKAVSIK